MHFIVCGVICGVLAGSALGWFTAGKVLGAFVAARRHRRFVSQQLNTSLRYSPPLFAEDERHE